MKSMTGFASKTTDEISLKLKSVNHRFFDFRFHGPQDLMVFEKEIRQKINQVVARGSIDLFIQTQAQKKSKTKVIDLDKAKAFYKDLKKLSQSLKIKSKDELELVLKFGDVFSEEDSIKGNKSKSSDIEAIKKTEFLKMIDILLKDFESERSREGKALSVELKDLLQGLEKIRLNLEVLAKDYPKEIESKIKEKIKIWKQEFDKDRLNQELLLLIDKSDVAEEIVRLKEHIKACLKLLSSGSSEGKKLDFYAQELFREVNTIGSKSSSVKITQEVMQAKSIVEKIRQQVQNIE
jgi:uncharacterized protein (TIGR00255 family)